MKGKKGSMEARGRKRVGRGERKEGGRRYGSMEQGKGKSWGKWGCGRVEADEGRIVAGDILTIRASCDRRRPEESIERIQ